MKSLVLKGRSIHGGVRRRTGVVAILVAVCIASPSMSERPKDVALHGFLSQGFLWSNKNNYLAESSQGSAEFSEVGITVSVSPLDRLRLGMQMLSRNLGREGNNDVWLDWGYADYRWRDALGFRVGKIKTPLGLHNKGRDLDMLRLPVLLPQGVYDEGMRQFILAIDGFGLYGYKPLSGLGDLDYEFQLGSRNFPDLHTGFWDGQFTDIGNSIARGIEWTLSENPNVPPGSVSASYVETHNREVSASNTAVCGLTWSPPIDGSRLGGVYIRTSNVNGSGRNEISIATATGDPANPTVMTTKYVPMQMFVDVDGYSFSAEFCKKGLTVTAEYFRIDWYVELRTSTTTRLINSTEGYYGQVSYQVTPWLAFGTYYSEYFPDRANRSGRDLDIAATAWQKDLTLSTRIDVTPFWISKLECHVIDGLAQVTDASCSDGCSRNWVLLALKNTFHF